MSLTVAAAPIRYHHQSLLQRDLRQTSSVLYAQTVNKQDAALRSKDLLFPIRDQSTRWSSKNRHSESKVEDAQMSSYGSAPLPSPDQDHQRQTHRFEHSPPGHVLPPIINPATGSNLQSRDKQPPMPSPNISIDRAAGEHGSERRGPRLLGVLSILNPSHGEEEQRGTRRRGYELDGNRRASLATLAPTSGSGAMAPRRILTPISPRIQRATSYGQTARTIDAIERPFLSDGSRDATPEHVGNNAQPYPHHHTSHVTQHSPFITPAAPNPSLIHPSRRTSVSVVGSSRPSPSPSYGDSYSQGGLSRQTSPSMHPVPNLAQGRATSESMRQTQSPNLGPMNTVLPGSLDGERGFHGPVVSSGQNYQILTVDTSKGHMQLPVEVQAASRMADEKRKRNAGASARFRARRKEKEREASSKISNLELDVTYAQEDSRHYRAERDFLADIITRNFPQYESHLKNRPPSPRHKRPLIPIRVPMTSIDSPGSTVDSEQYDDEPPVSRRRTESYTYPGVAGPNSQQQYPPAPYNTYAPVHVQLPAPQHHGGAQYPQQTAQPAHPPTFSRPPATPDHGYDRPWPRPAHPDQPR